MHGLTVEALRLIVNEIVNELQKHIKFILQKQNLFHIYFRLHINKQVNDITRNGMHSLFQKMFVLFFLVILAKLFARKDANFQYFKLTNFQQLERLAKSMKAVNESTDSMVLCVRASVLSRLPACRASYFERK